VPRVGGLGKRRLTGSRSDLAAAERASRRAVRTLRRRRPRTRRIARRLARALTRIGDLLQQQGRYRDAEPLLREAVTVSERAFGADHLEVATPLNNLAVCYKYLARYADAGPLYQRALSITERALGPTDPEVATLYHNLGGLEHAAGNWLRGEPFARKAVRIRTRALGSRHPDVAADLTALAALLDRQKKYAEAERLYRRALAIVAQLPLCAERLLGHRRRHRGQRRGVRQPLVCAQPARQACARAHSLLQRAPDCERRRADCGLPLLGWGIPRGMQLRRALVPGHDEPQPPRCPDAPDIATVPKLTWSCVVFLRVSSARP